MTGPDPDADARRLSADSYAIGDSTSWFEQLYAAAASGEAIVPWDRGAANPQLVEWAQHRSGIGRTAMVVGCGLGRDAEFIAGLGYATTAFDLSATAVDGARQRHPNTTVRYEVADLLHLPARYLHAFDLVVESYTVQSLPEPPRSAAIVAVTTMVAPGGTLLVIAAAGDLEASSGPPFPLTRREIEAFAVDGLGVDQVERLVDDGGTQRWRATFVRAIRSAHA